MVGMGRNLVLNMADHGFSVAGHDKDPGKVKALRTISSLRMKASRDSSSRSTNRSRPWRTLRHGIWEKSH